MNLHDRRILMAYAVCAAYIAAIVVATVFASAEFIRTGETFTPGWFALAALSLSAYPLSKLTDKIMEH